MTDIIDGLRELVKWLAGALFALGLWLWKKTDSRVEALEAGKASKADMDEVKKLAKEIHAELTSKADDAEMDRQRDNIASLFDAHTAIRNEMHQNHIAVMNTMSGISSQVANIAGRLEK